MIANIGARPASAAGAIINGPRGGGPKPPAPERCAAIARQGAFLALRAMAIGRQIQPRPSARAASKIPPGFWGGIAKFTTAGKTVRGSVPAGEDQDPDLGWPLRTAIRCPPGLEQV